MAKKVYFGDMRLATMADVQNYVASVIATLNLAPLDYITAGVDGLTRMDLSTGQFSMMLGGASGTGVFNLNSNTFEIGKAGTRQTQIVGRSVALRAETDIELHAPAGRVRMNGLNVNYEMSSTGGHVFTHNSRTALVAGAQSLSPTIDADTKVFGNFDGMVHSLPTWLDCITGDESGISKIKVSGTFTLGVPQAGWDKPVISLVNGQQLAIGGYVMENGPGSGFGIHTLNTVVLGNNVTVIAGESASSSETAADSTMWATSVWGGTTNTTHVGGSIDHHVMSGTDVSAYMSIRADKQLSQQTGEASVKMGVDGRRMNQSTGQPNAAATVFEQTLNLQTGTPVFAIDQKGFGTTDNNYLFRAFLEGSSAGGTEVGTLHGNIAGGGGGGGDLPSWASCIKGTADGISSIKVQNVFALGNFDAPTSSQGVFGMSPDGYGRADMFMFASEHAGTNQGVFLRFGDTLVDGMAVHKGTLDVSISNTATTMSSTTGIFALVAEVYDNSPYSFEFGGLVTGRLDSKLPGPPLPPELPAWISCIKGTADGVSSIKVQDEFALGNFDAPTYKQGIFGMTSGVYGGADMFMFVTDPKDEEYGEFLQLDRYHAGMSVWEGTLDVSIAATSTTFRKSTGIVTLLAEAHDTSPYSAPFGGQVAGILNDRNPAPPSLSPFIKNDSFGITSLHLSKNGFAMGMVDPSFPTGGTIIPVLAMDDSRGVSQILITNQFVLRMTHAGFGLPDSDILTVKQDGEDNANAEVVLGGAGVKGIAILSQHNLRLHADNAWTWQLPNSPTDALDYINGGNLKETSDLGSGLTLNPAYDVTCFGNMTCVGDVIVR